MVLTTLFLFFIVFLTNGHNIQAIVEFSDKAAEDLICPVKRTPLSIVWSCLATLLICAWASVHPNVPAKKKGLAWMNKLRVMFWMIIAPELVLAWAVRQRYAARKIRDVFNNTTPVQESECATNTCSKVLIVDLENNPRPEKLENDPRPFPWYGRPYPCRPTPKGLSSGNSIEQRPSPHP